MANEFTASVRRKLAERAGQRCSNPDCGQPTSGPSDNGSGGSTVLGRACHITAASEGGPRFDRSLTPKQRSHPNNGIWLCAICADRVDKNENAAMFPVELLRTWKEFHESLTGTDHASMLSRRMYPLRYLKIDDFAGVRGQASITFGAVTLVLGSSKLSHTVGELVNLFSSHEEFKQTRQPASGISEQEDRISLPDERAWVISVRHNPPRMFATRGRLRLKQSDGREFIITTKTTGATLSLGDLPIPVFSPAITAILVGKSLDSRSASLKVPEQRLARYFGISELELRSCIEGVPTDESVFGYEYDFNSEALLVRLGSTEPHQSLDSLSGGERSRVLLDIGIRVAGHRSKVGPIVLLVDQHRLRMDPQGWVRLFEWLEETRPPFQTVVDLCYAPSKGSPSRTLCYEAMGTDMEVSSFQITPWESFKCIN